VICRDEAVGHPVSLLDSITPMGFGYVRHRSSIAP
jgi:hypothetical protein